MASHARTSQVTNVPIVFNDQDELLTIIERGGEMMDYFQSKGVVGRCDLVTKGMASSTLIASGKYGSVFSFSLGESSDTGSHASQESQEYVVKKVVNKSYSFVKVALPEYTKGRKIGEVIQILSKSRKFPEEIFYAANIGVNPEDEVVIGRYYAMPKVTHIPPCKIDEETIKMRWRFSSKSDGSAGAPQEKVPAGLFVYPVGSYICDSATHTEYLIGLMCASLLKRGYVGFLDTFGFSMCTSLTFSPLGAALPAVHDYTFMQRAKGTLVRDLKPYLRYGPEAQTDEGVRYNAMLIDSLVIQTVFALSSMQRILGIQHNDLHPDNVMFDHISSREEYISYEIDGKSVYFGNCGLLAKIVDFGFAAKYSSPIVIPDKLVDGSSAQIPSWRDDYYDLQFFITGMWGMYGNRSAFLSNFFVRLMDPYTVISDHTYTKSNIRTTYDRSKKIFERLGGVYYQRSGTKNNSARSAFGGLALHPWEYLTDPYTMGPYLRKPPFGSKVLTLGRLSPTDFHPDFYDGNEKPLHLLGYEEIRSMCPCLGVDVR